MPLTAAQLVTLKNDMGANTNTIKVAGVDTQIKNITAQAFPNRQDIAPDIAAWYNLNASPSFWVWNTITSLADTGMAIKMSDIGNLTTANSTRLQVSFSIRPNGFNPANQDDRSLFGSLFSVAGAAGTRAALIALWQRLASNLEKLFATGTGSQVTGDLNSDGSVSAGSPATMGVSEQLTAAEVIAAWNS